MAKSPSVGILLVNLGTPDSPSVPDVRKYLREFLMDRRVIDIPYVNRFFLINGIIAPFRAPKSSKVYKELWQEEGSPLLFYGVKLKELVQAKLGPEYLVSFGMRYQSPSLESALAEMEGKGLEKIVVLSMFPQYASASTGSAVEEVMKIIGKWEVVPTIRFINKFFDDPGFIRSFAAVGKKYMEKMNYDHFLFTYHGLPERQILKSSVQEYCQLGNCCNTYNLKNRYCYRAQCFETTRLLTAALGINKEDYTVGFQSRLGKTPWIKPYTDELIPDLIKKGKKSILVFSPSFVADCLETTIEGGVEYKELFEKFGGVHWQLVESLNDSAIWVDSVVNMVTN